MIFDIDSFRGEVPRISKKLLPNGYAYSAINCDMSGGNLAPDKGCTLIQALSGATVSIFKHGATWRQWSSVVDIVHSFVHDNDNRIIITGDSYPKETDSSLFPSTRRLGIPAPTGALVITLGGTAGDDVDRTISYVYTIVGVWADGSVTESAPSLPTAVIDVYDGQTVTLTGFENAANAYTTNFRLYRLLSGTAGAEFQYVDEFSISSSSYLDSVSESSLGEVLPTEGWTTPNESLSGLISTSSGINVGFVGNKVYPSETFIGYAYPSDYSLTTETDIVGLGFIGSSIVVLTDTKPYILIGQNPESLSMEKIPYDQACLSKRSIVSFPGGVAFACPDGLAIISASGVLSIITEKLFTKTQWAALEPETMIGFWYDGSYYAFFSGKSTYIRIDLNASEVTRGDLPANAYGGHYVAVDDILYLVLGTALTKSLYSFRTDTVSSMTWVSGTKTLENRVPMAGRVLGDFSAGSSVITMVADGSDIFSKTVTGDGMFRFTPKRVGKAYLTVTGKATIDRILVGETGQEVLDV